MTQLTPEQALLIHNALLLPSIKVEHRITRAVIAALPDDQKDYRPNEVAKTAFDLAWHLASAEHGFRMGVINGVFDFSGLDVRTRCGRRKTWRPGTPRRSRRTSTS